MPGIRSHSITLGDRESGQKRVSFLIEEFKEKKKISKAPKPLLPS